MNSILYPILVSGILLPFAFMAIGCSFLQSIRYTLGTHCAVVVVYAALGIGHAI